MKKDTPEIGVSFFVQVCILSDTYDKIIGSIKKQGVIIMIRKGTLDDMPQIESLFDEHFQYQKKYESYTINQRGIFPSTEGLTNAVKNGVLYVREDDGEITAMIVLDNQQPPEFDNIDWLTKVPTDGAAVIHMVNTRPRHYRKGLAREFIAFAEDWGRENGCTVLRSECGSQNLPAVLMFKHLGFERVGVASIKVSGIVQADGHIFFEKKL